MSNRPHVSERDSTSFAIISASKEPQWIHITKQSALTRLSEVALRRERRLELAAITKSVNRQEECHA